MICIRGISMTAMSVAATLDYLGIDFRIEAIDDAVIMPDILLIKHKPIYQAILEYAQSDVQPIRVGYFYDGYVHNHCSIRSKHDYLAKQNRQMTASSMSDSSNQFLAADLHDVYFKLRKKYADRTSFVKMFSTDAFVIDTTNYHIPGYTEYVVKTETDMPYDYVYDCSKSNIKRLSRHSVEFIKKPEGMESIPITNYYDPFKVIESPTVLRIGRSATGTQTKQSDVIDYILSRYKEVK